MVRCVNVSGFDKESAQMQVNKYSSGWSQSILHESQINRSSVSYDRRTQDLFIANIFFCLPDSFGTVKMLNEKILKVESESGKYVLRTRNKGACE